MEKNNRSTLKYIIHTVLQFLPLIFILCLGAYLRLYKIDAYMTFLGDEGRDVLIVKRMIVDHKWTLLGPTASVGGFFMGPIYYYFMLPFLWIWKLNPVGTAVMVALIGIMTIYIVYRTGYTMFGKTEGLGAAFLYALSPLVIAYSRSSWNPNIVPFFSTLLLYLCFRIVTNEKWQYLFWVGLILGIGIQLHYTFLFLFFASGLWLLIHGHENKHIRWYGAAFIGFILGFSPFLAFEIRHGFTNTRSILLFVFAGKDTGFTFVHFFGNIFSVLFHLFGRSILRIPDAGVLVNFGVFKRTAWISGSYILTVFSVIMAIVRITNRKIGNVTRVSLKLMLFWIGIILVFFGLYKKPIYDYYFGICFAIPFLLLMSAISSFPLTGKMRSACIIIMISFLALFNWQGRPFIYPPNNQLNQVKTISLAVLDKTNGKPFNFALITGGNSDFAYRYFFELWARSPIVIENNSVDPERKTVTDQLLVVCEYPSCQPLGNSLWEVAGFGRADIAGVWDVSVVKIYKLIHYKEMKTK